ncbi:MAG: hypothetical protein WAT79_01680 [Saprospiraceae bacterium]
MRKLFWVLVGLILLFLVGPSVKYEPVKLFETSLSLPTKNIEHYVQTQESKIVDLKPGNESQVFWYGDSLYQKTKYVLLYLHGFSASPFEGKKMSMEFGKKFNCNVYLHRLEDHGRLDSNSLINLTPDNYLQSAEDAIDIAQNMGDSIILMSCSTGSTLGLILAAHGEKIHSHFMYSPNIDIYDKKSNLLLFPWGKQMSRLVMKGEYQRLHYEEMQRKYWNETYHMNGVFALKYMIRKYMLPKYFEKITHPVFMAYYYKDENNQDDVVSVPRMLDMFNQLGTKPKFKKMMAFPEAQTHMVVSELFCKQWDDVQKETFLFAENVLGLPTNPQK